MGLHRAGFDVTGVDLRPQPRYPFRFVQADALAPPLDLAAFDFIWASPPCQAFSKAGKLQGNSHPRLIEPVRRMLREAGRPYVIENVPGAPLLNPAVLCGSMFGLRVHRPRGFVTSFPMPFDLAPPAGRQAKMGRPVRDGELIHVVGHFSNVPLARDAMDIGWMTQGELALAIPPAYAEFIARAWLGQQTALAPTIPRRRSRTGGAMPADVSCSTANLPRRHVTQETPDGAGAFS